MWWPFQRTVHVVDPGTGYQEVIKQLLSINDQLRRDNEALHDRLLRMHTIGLEEHERALAHRRASTSLDIKRQEKAIDAVDDKTPLERELEHEMGDPYYQPAVQLEEFGGARNGRPALTDDTPSVAR